MRKAFILAMTASLLMCGTVFAQVLSGEWTLGVDISPNVPTFSDAIDFSSALTVNYELGDWLLTSLTDFDDNGWAWQTFIASGVLGAWVLDTSTEFDPIAGDLNYLQLDWEVSLAGLAFDGYFALGDEEVYLGVSALGTTDLLEIDVGVSLGELGNDVCDLNWRHGHLGIDFPFCCANVGGLVFFDCDGFRFAFLLADDITLPNLPWISFYAQLQFQTDSKNLVIGPLFDFGEFGGCIELYVDQENTLVMSPGGSTTLEDFIVDGISIECEYGGIAFTATSFWGTHGCRFRTEDDPYCDFPGILAGRNQEYWEAYRIATTDEGCCGPFGFDVTVFFHEASTRLFDVALFEASMTVQLAEQFTFGMGVDYDVDSGVSEWRLDFTVIW